MKKIVPFLIILLLVAGGCAPAPAQTPGISAPAPAYKEQTASGGASPTLLYGRGFLSAEEQAVYDQLYRACDAYDISMRLPLPGGIDAERFDKLADWFGGDNPRFYWALPALSDTADGRCVTLSVRGGLSVGEVLRRDAEIEQAALAMLDGLPAERADYMFAVHDRLVERVNYDGGNLRENSENIYGALVKRYAVCDGYARAFQYLMQRGGVDCAWFRGSSLRDVAHAWNAVRLEDEWYYVDVTWDATDPWRRRTFHNYLGITLEETRRSHIFDADQYPALPRAESRARNYHYYNGFAFEPARGEELAQLTEAFVSRLAAEPAPKVRERVFLDIKIYADKAEYLRVKELFVKELYPLLQGMNDLARERGLAVEIETGGEARCNFSDEQQVLILLPTIEKK